MELGKSQYINEESRLSSIEQVFERTIKEYETSEDPYQQSILKGKLERILLEFAQKNNGEETSKEALSLQSRLEKAFTNLKILNSETAVDPAVQQQLTQLVQEMKQLLQQYESVSSI